MDLKYGIKYEEVVNYIDSKIEDFKESFYFADRSIQKKLYLHIAKTSKSIPLEVLANDFLNDNMVKIKKLVVSYKKLKHCRCSYNCNCKNNITTRFLHDIKKV